MTRESRDLKFDQPPFSWETLDDMICGVMPEIAGVARVWRPIASAFIYRKSTGKELIGSGGWRLYIVVDDASQIPAIGDTSIRAYGKPVTARSAFRSPARGSTAASSIQACGRRLGWISPLSRHG